MKREKSPLDRVEVAAPCSASWEEMAGDERVRFCDHCALNVYNLSAMGRTEAEELVHAHEGRLCIRFYKRRDGTLLTDNCPVGLRRARARQKILAGAAASVVAAILGLRPVPGRTVVVGDLAQPIPPKLINVDPPRATVTMGMRAPRVEVLGEGAPTKPKSGRWVTGR